MLGEIYSTRKGTFFLTARDLAIKSFDKFLLKISPEYAIISTDSPSLKVLEQLKNHKIFSTSDYGTITINSDGEYIEVTN